MNKILLISAAFIAVAAPAHADPITAIATWVGGAIGVGAATALAITQFVVGFALNAVAAALMKPDVPGANVQFDVQMGDDQPLSFTVGDYATAGKRKYVGSWGRNTRFVTEVIEYSALPQGLAGIWIDDERGEFVAGQRGYVMASDSPNDVRDQLEAASVPGGGLDIGQPLTNYADDGNRIYVKWVSGNQSDADPFLIWAFGADPDYPWTADMIGTGKSYAIVTMRYDDDTLTHYPQYLIEPAPLPMYDLRLDSTNGGSGAHRWDNPATWAPTANPVVIAYNVARGIHFGTEWVYGGKNLAAWRLPAAEWIAGANECDDAVSLAGGGTEPRCRCGMEIRCNVPAADVLEEIGKGANMRFAETGGQLKPIVGLPAAAAFAFTDDDIVITEGQSFKPFYPVAETFNAISATYPEPVEKWSSKDAREYIDTDATAEDGGRYLPTSMTYGAVPYRRQIRRLMRSQMRDYRRMRRHQFHLPPDAYALEPGVDMVSWTSQRNGYVSKLFMVESVAKTPGMLVLVSLREVDPGDYDWSSSFEAPPTVVVPKNPVRFNQPISGLAVFPAVVRDADGTGRRPAIRVSCDGDETGVTDIQIQARVLGEPTTIDTTRRFGGDYEWYLANVLPLTAYEVRARLLSELTPKSSWSPWLSVITLKAGYTTDDIADQVLDSMRDIAAEAGVDAVDVLPATGEPGQIVMKVPEGVLYRWDDVSGEWTTEIYAGIPDGAVNIAKFAAGIEPVSIITDASLPTVKTTEAILWQSKLYRWSGTAYTAAVPSSDLTGQITGTQITDGAVTTPKLAAGAVEADNIAANAVTAGKIAAGAVSADQIAAEAITASKLAVGGLENLFSGFDDPASSPFVPVGWAGVWSSTATHNGQNSIRVAEEGVGTTLYRMRPIPVNPGEEYFFAIWVAKAGSWDGTTGNSKLRIGNQAGALVAAIPYDATIPQYTIGFERRTLTYTVPAGVSALTISLVNDSTTGSAFISGMEMRLRNSGELIVDGAITTNKIAAGAVEANSIAAAAIVASKIAAGAVTADKVLANSITSTQINVAQLVGSAAFLDNLVVDTAQIANAAIDSAKIANLAVQTFNIAGGAVSSFERSFTNGSVGIPQNSDPVIQTLSYTIGRTGPQALFVAFNVSAGATTATLLVRVFRVQGGTETEIYREDFDTDPTEYAFHRLVVDGANISGAVTYRLRALSQGGAHSASGRFLGALNVYK